MKKLLPKEFPPLLREINDPPKHLYLEGILPKQDELTYLTVVGSRRNTTYGKEACEHIIGGLGNYPIAIVSGLAIGIDTIAHQAALKAKLPTIAIPGSGLDMSVLHPPSNKRLADKIVGSGGALISEMEPKEPAGVHTFPRRNRIMAGISKAVLVIEAGEKSGTLITARLALDYNRDILAVPGSIFSQNSLGTNRLIADGATPVTSHEDVLLALGFDVAESDFTTSAQKLSDEEKHILDILVEPLARDELIRACGKPAHEINPILTMMEMRNLIVVSGGIIRANTRNVL